MDTQKHIKELSQRDRIIRIEHAIMGNGTKGLNERISDLEKEVKGRFDEMAERQRHFEKYIWVGIGGLGVIGIVIELVFKK